jgi:hypothetical protein
MERSPDGYSAGEPAACPKKAKAPLWQRMYFRREMTEIVRLMGYDELTIEDARERLRPLLDVHGKALIEKGAAELLTIDANHTPATARLSDEARTLAIQILGRPKDRAAKLPATVPPAPVDDQAVPPPVDPEANAQRRARRRRTESRPTGLAAELTAGNDSMNAGTDGPERSPSKKRAAKRSGEPTP